MRYLKIILGILVLAAAGTALTVQIKNEATKKESTPTPVASVAPKASPSVSPSAAPGAPAPAPATSDTGATATTGTDTSVSSGLSDIDLVIQEGLRAGASVGCKANCHVQVHHIRSGFASANTNRGDGSRFQQLFGWDGSEWNILLQQDVITQSDLQRFGAPSTLFD